MGLQLCILKWLKDIDICFPSQCLLSMTSDLSPFCLASSLRMRLGLRLGLGLYGVVVSAIDFPPLSRCQPSSGSSGGK